MMKFDPETLANTTPLDFWQDRYTQSASRERERGRAGTLLQQKVAALAPGRVLELGCSTGDDSLWLAEQGWQVTGVDISPAAVETAQRLAAEAGLADRTHFQALDLCEALPAGQFQLITGLYFQSPFPDFPRERILRELAQQLEIGGHLLLVTHGSRPPWTDHGPETYPTPEEEYAALGISGPAWKVCEVSACERPAKTPAGEQVTLTDNVILLQRL